MSPRVEVDPGELRSAASKLRRHAPKALKIPDDLKRQAQQADRSNRGFMTGEAGESLAEAAEDAMKHYEEHIEFEAEQIEACADDWDASDGEIRSSFDPIGSDISGFTVPRINGGPGAGI